MVSAQCFIHHYHSSLGQTVINWGREDYHITCTVIYCLTTQCSEEAISMQWYLTLILFGHACFQWGWKARLMKHSPYSFGEMVCYLQWNMIINISIMLPICHLAYNQCVSFISAFTYWSHIQEIPLVLLLKWWMPLYFVRGTICKCWNIGNTMAIDQVICWKHDDNCNPICSSNQNLSWTQASMNWS